MYLLLILGILGLVASALLTHLYWRKAGTDTYAARYFSAGSGIVPSWVSLLGLASWACTLRVARSMDGKDDDVVGPLPL